MAKYPIKMLKDEEGTPFVPLVSTESLRTPEGVTIEEELEKKLEPSNLIAGTDITLSVDGNNITINNASKGVLIDNLTTEQSGIGSLDAHQGKVLKDMIPDVVNNLTTTSTDKALSAYQGYLLNHKVVPTGGTTGQVLKKSSDDDHALEWGDAADPNAIIGDGSIKKIIELTYEEYQALEAIDPDTEYHIIDAQSSIDELQATLDSLQEQINSVRNKINAIASKSSGGYVVTSGDGVTEMGKYIDFHSDFTTGNDYDTRLYSEGNNRNEVKMPSESGTLALVEQVDNYFNNLGEYTFRENYVTNKTGTMPSSTAYSNIDSYTNTKNYGRVGIFMVYLVYASNSTGTRGLNLKSGVSQIIASQCPGCSGGNTTRLTYTYPLQLQPNETVYIQSFQDSGGELGYTYSIKILWLDNNQ